MWILYVSFIGAQWPDLAAVGPLTTVGANHLGLLGNSGAYVAAVSNPKGAVSYWGGIVPSDNKSSCIQSYKKYLRHNYEA